MTNVLSSQDQLGEMLHRPEMTLGGGGGGGGETSPVRKQIHRYIFCMLIIATAN